MCEEVCSRCVRRCAVGVCQVCSTCVSSCAVRVSVGV